MVKITALDVGFCTHPACVALKGAGLRERAFPARCYVLDTSRGVFLWDTGYAEHFRTATADGIYRLYAKVTPVHFNCQDALVGQLAARGMVPHDVRGVLLSHFHGDHIAGLKDFPGVPVWCAQEGWARVKDRRGLSALRRGFLPSLVPDDVESRLRFFETTHPRPLPEALQPFEYGHDVLGTGELFTVPLPGHADGHTGLFVQADDGWHLLAGDAAWAPEGYRDLRGPSELSFLIQTSRTAYYATLERLHRLHRHGMVRIHLSHESTHDDAPVPTGESPRSEGNR